MAALAQTFEELSRTQELSLFPRPRNQVKIAEYGTRPRSLCDAPVVRVPHAKILPEVTCVGFIVFIFFEVSVINDGHFVLFIVVDFSLTSFAHPTSTSVYALLSSLSLIVLTCTMQILKTLRCLMTSLCVLTPHARSYTVYSTSAQKSGRRDTFVVPGSRWRRPEGDMEIPCVRPSGALSGVEGATNS